MSVIAFLSYVIVTSITPGPSNILMMNEARRFGFAGSWRFSSGILGGFAVLGILSGAFTTGLYRFLPVVAPYFKMAGAAYLLYLAWQIGWHRSSEKEGKEMKSSFLSGFMIQLINVKSILYFLTVMSVFILPFTQEFGTVVFYLSLSIVIGWLALLLWSGFGSVFKTFFARHDKSFRWLMGSLLAYSAIRIMI